MSWRQWIRTVEIEPALSAANPSTLDAQVESLLRSGCKIFRLDVDEHGYRLLETLAPLVHHYGGVLDVRLGGEANVLEAIMRGADSVTVDTEVEDVAMASGIAREHGRQFGIVFPESEKPDWLPLEGGIDVVSVAVDDSTTSLLRVREIATALPDGVCLQVEGALSHETVGPFHASGASVLVVGRPIFEREDLPRTYRRLVQALA